MASHIKTFLACSVLAFVTAHAAQKGHVRDTFVRQTTSSPVVDLKNGSYEGLYSSEYDQDFFLGMRYAKPAERFQLAQPLSTIFNGTTQPAKTYPPHCVGYGGDDTGYEVSEDCLYLNVIRPAGINSAAGLPVAFWMHGGGLYMGGSADKRYNLSFIVQNSVELGTPMIGVSINYRLSAYGFLLGSEALEAGIANNGFRDQRQALRWVNENIAAFGGDPTKVTIWGESSGAESVNAQVLAYNGRDDGLFRAAIAESGFGGTIPRFAGGFNATDLMQETYNTLVSNTSCAPTVNTNASLSCLRALPFAELNIALNGSAIDIKFQPMLDGDFIADYPGNQLTAGRFPRIPVLIGANTDEGSAFAFVKAGRAVTTDADMRLAVANFIGAQAPAMTGKSLDQLVDEALFVYPDIQAVGIPRLDRFPVILPGDGLATALGLQYRRTAAYFGDFMMHYTRRRANIAWSKAGLPSYGYSFDVVVNGMPDFTAATHFQEVAFVFDNTDGLGYATNPFANTTAAFPALAKTMSTAWVNFVTGLDPNGPNGLGIPGLEAWPVYNASAGGGVGKELIFDVDGSYAAWDNYRAEGIQWMIDNSLSLFGT